MRSKVKVISREEILKNFTRDFLIEEKKRCEIDRYVTDFRILIHKRPHENHNYLNRLLQDYTSMFLSHERISVNKSNEGEMKHRLIRQLNSKMKDSPKKRYVKSKLFSKNSENSEHQSYLIMKAKTTEFLLQLQKYEELEQIAYELFAKHSNNEYANEIRGDPNRNCSYNHENYVLKVKTVEIPLEIPYKKTFKHVYVVNNPKTKHVMQGSQDSEILPISSNSPQSPTKNLLEDYEYVKEKTSKFLENNKNYNDAEQKVLSEQYQLNCYIKKYVDNLNSFNENVKKSNSPKKSFFNKIKNMMGFHSENTDEIHRNKKEKPLPFIEETIALLKNEKTYSDFEFEAYKLFHTNNGKFENPLIEYNKNDIHAKTLHLNRDMNKSSYDNEKFENDDHCPSPLKKPNLERFSHTQSPNSENNNQFVGVMKDIEFQFNPAMEHPDEIKFDPRERSPIVSEENIDTIHKTLLENTSRNETEKADQENRFLREKTKEFILLQKKYEDEQLKFYIMFINQHPSSISKSKNKKDSLLYKIKQLFKFSKTGKSNENLYYFRQLTDEFLRNERYCYDQDQITVVLTEKYPTDAQADAEIKKEAFEVIQKTPDSKTIKLSPFDTKHKNKFEISPSVLHQRSRSEDLLTLKSKSKSLDNTRKISSPGHKSLSDRIKRMVGIGNRKRTKSRENILHLTDPVQYFLDHERFYYDGEPISKLYNRSVSLQNQSVKTSAPKRKTDNSLSTQNISLQDQNSRISTKPPTGRRRQERRSEEGKSKRRSRTLSPAQKLVSKFKSIIQREDKNKDGKKNWEFFRKETEKFLEDQKNFVDVPENYSSNAQFQNIKSNGKKRSVINEKNEIDENHPSRSSLYYPEQRSTKQQTETSSAGIDINSDDLKFDHPVNTHHQTISDKINLHGINHTPMKAPSSSKKEDIVFDNTEFLKKQTEIFLHNMKKYNDFDKNANDVNKTLIFINNKTSTLRVISGADESVEAVGDTQHSKAIFDGKQEKCMLNRNFQNQFSEQNLTVRPISQAPKKSPKNCKDFSKQESHSEAIGCRTFDKEKVITRRVFSEKIQTKSITITNSEKVDSQNEQNMASPQVNNAETEKTLNNKSKEKHIEVSNITSVEKTDHSLVQNLGANIHHSTKDNVLQAASMMPPKESTEKILSKSENISKNVESFSETNSKKNSIITYKENSQLPRNPRKEFLENEYFSHDEEVMPDSSIYMNKKVDHSNEEKYQSKLPASNENRPKTDERKVKECSAIKKKSLIIDTDISTQTEENNWLIRKQTAEFLNQLKKYSNEVEGSKKSNIFWLSEKKILPQKFVEIHQSNHELNSTQKSKSEHEDLDYLTNLFHKKQTDVFLKDHKNYHDEQKMNDNKFIQKSTEPQNKLSFSSEIPEKHKSKSKIEKLLSPSTSKKTQYGTDERNTILRYQEYPLLMNQTIEFLNRNQYLIHEDEMNFHKSDIPLDVSLEKRSVESEVSMLKKEAHQKLKNSKSNTTGNTISKIKSFITSSPKPFRIGENHKMIKQQTIDFLEDTKRYNNEEYENCSRYRFLWLSENDKFSGKVDEVLGKNIPINKIKKYCSDKNDSEQEADMYFKNQTGIFLKDHKDYHNKQRNEDNRFYQKLKEPENKFWLSKSHEKENKKARGFENSICPTSSKKTQQFNEEKTRLQLRDQTSEFLDTNQYSSNKEEINLKNTNNSENHADEKKSHFWKATPNQLEKPKDDVDQTSSNRTKKQKNSPFSKIKSLIIGNRQQLPDKEEFSSIIKQTTKFLEDMENYTHNEYEASSKYKINWLSENGILPQTIDRTAEQNSPTKIEKDYRNGDRACDRESFALINTSIEEHNTTFLKAHKDYHDRQINDENKFYQKVGKPKQNFWLSSNNEKRNFVVRKIDKLISPVYSNKLHYHSDINSWAPTKDQTAEFLDKNQYFIHEQEIKLDQGRESHDKMISAQTAEFLENLKRYNDIHFDSSAKMKMSSLNAENTHSRNQNKFPSRSISELESSGTHNQKSVVTSKSEITNDNKCELISQNPITKFEKRKLEKISPEGTIGTNNSEYKWHLIDTQKTDTFLKDIKSFHDKQRIEDNNFLSKMGKPKRKFWLSSTNFSKNENNRITDEIEKLCSPTLSKQPQHSNKEESYLHEKNKTAEFLDRNQYLIYEEELNLNNLHNISDKTCEQKTQIMKIKKNERTFDAKEKDQTSRNSIRKVNRTFSKIKSFIIGNQKQTQMKEDHKVIMQHTIEFLEDLKMYTNEESGMNSKRTVNWLCEQKRVSSTVSEIDRKNDSEVLIQRKCSEDSEKKVPTKLVKECKIEGNIDDSETYEYIKKHTFSFLNEHKDYHNRQRIEDNKFHQKSSKSEEENCSFSNITNENTINHKIQKLISPAVSKPLKHPSDAKACILLRNKTAEFLKKNQYLIHEEEMNLKLSSADKSVKQETDMSIVTVNQQSLNKNTVASNKQKRGTFSKIKSLITGKRNQPLKKEDCGLFRKQTAEFLENLKEYNRKEFEVMSMEKIVWLCDKEVIPQKIVSAEVIEENRSGENDIDYQKYNILIKKQNESFLNDHKDYHNKQRIEENKFIKKFCEPEEKLGLSTNISQKHIIGRKIKKFLSPNVPKKSRHSINEGTYLLMRDQTAKFLKENQYSIYKEEVHPESVTNSVNFESKGGVNCHKESVSLSTVPRPECRNKIENTTKLCETKSVDEPSIGNNKKIIGKQVEISENSKECINSQKESYCLSDDGISSINQNEPLQKPHPTVIKRNEGKNENRYDKMQVLREMNDTFLRDHKEYNNNQWMDYKLPHNVKISDQKLSISLKTEMNDNGKSESTTLESTEGSHSNTIASEKKIISELNSDKFHPIRRITTNNNNIFDNQSKNSYERNNENVDVNKKSVLLFSNDQKQSPNIKKKVTFSDYQETNEDESCNGTDKSKMIKQKTQLFLEKNQDYHNVQWSEYKRFHQKNPEAEEKHSCEKTSESYPVALEAKYIDSFCSPEKAADVNNERASKEMKGLSMKFHQKKQQYLICDEEIYENEMKPKPTPRKLKTNQKLLIEQNKSHEVSLLVRENTLLFLQDHQSYHNKERQELIHFETDRKKHLENNTKTSGPKEKKSKSKLISKLKSFVEGSTEIFSSDNRKRDNELKKQTAEFLISQKCFWDLQRTDELIFAEKQDPTKYDKETELRPNYSKNLSKTYFHPQMENKKQVTADKLTIKTSDNSTLQSPNDYQKKIIKEYEFLRRKNELFLKDHQRYHDSELKDFIAFSVHRKKNRNESPNENENIQNIIPQNSSYNQKSLEMDISMKNENEPPVQNKQNIDAEPINNICAIFLDNQRCYIDSANEGWRRYVMYKPEVAVLRKNISESKSPNSKQQSSTKMFPKLNNQQYSEPEGDNIDYEVNLHKTKLFLENLKNYHDNLQNEFADYVPKNIYRNDISEPQPRDKRDGVLDKIKSIFPSSHNKMSYNVQKHKYTSNNPKEIRNIENEPVITKFEESSHIIYSKVHVEDVPIIMLKKQTDLFLKDHQHYHNRQRADSIEYFGKKSNEVQLLERESGKNKRTKKSVMSKLKSLLGSDSSKNSKNKKIQDDDFFKTSTKLFLEDQIQYSLIEKSDKQIFNESKPKLEVRNIESTPMSRTSVSIQKNNEEEHSIENNDQYSEQQSRYHQEDEEIPVNKTSLDITNEKSGVPIAGIIGNSDHETSVTHENTIHLSNLQVYNNEISDETSLLTNAMSNNSKTERENHAREKIQTQEFLLNQKQFASTARSPNLIYSSEPLQSAYIESRQPEDKNIEAIASKCTFYSRNDAENIPSCNSEDTNSRVVTNVRESSIQAQNKNEHYTMKEKSNFDSSLVERVERPMSPTKTIFKELRTIDNSPDNRVYILNEGYTITREANKGEKLTSTKNLQKQQYEPINNRCLSQENKNSSSHYALPQVENMQAEEVLGPLSSTGQDSTSDSIEYSHSQRRSQGELLVKELSKRRTYREMEEEPRSFITEARIENNGEVTQRYTTSCYFHQVPTAIWYTESLILDLEEKSQKIREKAYYVNQLRPDYWSETFETDVTTKEKMFVSETVIPISHDSDYIHYISLENQQDNPQNQMVCNDE